MGGLNNGIKAYNSGQNQSTRGGQSNAMGRMLGGGHGGLPDSVRNSDPLYYGTDTIYNSRGEATTQELLDKAVQEDPNSVNDTWWNEYVLRNGLGARNKQGQGQMPAQAPIAGQGMSGSMGGLGRLQDFSATVPTSGLMDDGTGYYRL